MKDNILLKIARLIRSPYIQTVTHYSDGSIIMGADNPTPLTRKTKMVEIFKQERLFKQERGPKKK